MAESSRFWTTSGTGDGPSGGYSAQQFYDFLRKLLITDQGAAQGVIFGEANQLSCSGTASPIVANTGSAIAYGFFYENTGTVNLTVATPTVGTTGGRVNLKVDWTAQTVRLVANRNTDGVIAIPALTQTPGSVWEVPLYTFTITTGGVITLTDARTYIEVGTKVLPGSVDSEAIQDNAVTNTKILDASVTAAKLGTGAVTAGKIATGGVSAAAQFAAGVVDNAALATDAVTQVKIANDAIGPDEIIDNTVNIGHLGNGSLGLRRRVGGDSVDWTVAGNTAYTIYNVHMAAGAVQTSSSADVSVVMDFDFPSTKPIVIAQCYDTAERDIVVTVVSGTQFTVSVYNSSGARVVETVYWLAIGWVV